jgi:hypothetical protein
MSRNPAWVALGDLSRRLKTALEAQTQAERQLEVLTERNLVLEVENDGLCLVINRQNREIWALRRQITGENADEHRAGRGNRALRG